MKAVNESRSCQSKQEVIQWLMMELITAISVALPPCIIVSEACGARWVGNTWTLSITLTLKITTTIYWLSSLSRWRPTPTPTPRMGVMILLHRYIFHGCNDRATSGKLHSERTEHATYIYIHGSNDQATSSKFQSKRIEHATGKSLSLFFFLAW